MKTLLHIIVLCTGTFSAYPAIAEIDRHDTCVITLGNNTAPIILRRLPTHADVLPVVTTAAKPPEKDPADDQMLPLYEKTVDTPYEIPILYLAEKELSLGQVKALVGEKSWTLYQQSFYLDKDGKLSEIGKYGTGTKQRVKDFYEAIETGSDKMPAAFIDLPLMTQITKSLQTSNVSFTKQPLSGELEEFFIRLPTRREWQYAARAVNTSAELAKIEFFPNWIDFNDGANDTLEIKAAYDELRLGINKDVMDGQTPTQRQFVTDVASFYQANSTSGTLRRKGYRILADILKKELPLEYDLSKQETAGFYPCMDPHPNAWGFHRLFGNVAEWTLLQSDVAAADKFWSDISKDLKAHREKPFGTMMGGSTYWPFKQELAWQQFSIAHGMVDDLGKPFSVAAWIESETAFKNLYKHSGIRILLRRRLSPKWFIALRRDVRNEEDYAVVKDKYLGYIDKLCIVRERAANNAYVTLYDRYKNKPLRPLRFDSNDADLPLVDATREQMNLEKKWWQETSSLLYAIGDSHKTEADRRLEAALAMVDTKEKQTDKTKPKAKLSPAEQMALKRLKRPKTTSAAVNYFALMAEIDNAVLSTTLKPGE